MPVDSGLRAAQIPTEGMRGDLSIETNIVSAPTRLTERDRRGANRRVPFGRTRRARAQHWLQL